MRSIASAVALVALLALGGGAEAVAQSAPQKGAGTGTGGATSFAEEGLFSPAVRQADGQVKTGHFKEALAMLRKAATPQDPSAEYALGTFLMRGMDHAQPNPGGGYTMKATDAGFTEGIGFVTKAAAHGFTLADAALGWGYELGKRIPRNFQIALAYYESAAAHGSATGKRGVTRMRSDLGTWAQQKSQPPEGQADDATRAQDYKTALELYRKAASAGSAPAMYAIGVFYDEGKAVNADHAEAQRWYLKSAQKSYPPGEWAMGGYGRPTGLDQVTWLRKAADHGVTIAMLQLGGAMVSGLPGVAKDEKAGLNLIKAAADREDTFAKLAIAQLYWVGRPGFVAKDQNKALRLVAESEQDGNPAAGSILRQMLQARENPARQPAKPAQ